MVFLPTELLRKARSKLDLPYTEWCHKVTQLQPQREAWQPCIHPPPPIARVMLPRKSQHTCPRVPTDPRGSSDPAAGRSCPERTDFCFHKYQCATVAPYLLADGQFIVLPSKEADILFPKYQGSDRLNKGSFIYFFFSLVWTLFCPQLLHRWKRREREGHHGMLQQLNATSSFPPVIYIQSAVRFFWKARKQPPLVTASHS